MPVRIFKQAEVHEEIIETFYCNGHEFSSLKEARAYKKRKNAEYGYVKHEIRKETYRITTLRQMETVK